jgi:hypothetical protein
MGRLKQKFERFSCPLFFTSIIFSLIKESQENRKVEDDCEKIKLKNILRDKNIILLCVLVQFAAPLIVHPSWNPKILRCHYLHKSLVEHLGG